MTMKVFLTKHRDELDFYIRGQCGDVRLNDHERRLWMLNDEGLYWWARREGVRV